MNSKPLVPAKVLGVLGRPALVKNCLGDEEQPVMTGNRENTGLKLYSLFKALDSFFLSWDRSE